MLIFVDFMLHKFFSRKKFGHRELKRNSKNTVCIDKENHKVYIKYPIYNLNRHLKIK